MREESPFIENDPVKRAEQIYFVAIDIEDEHERNAFIESECAGNDTILRNVQNLFGLQDKAAQIFEARSPTRISAVEIANNLAEIPEFNATMISSLPDDDEVGKQIGNYKLLQKIGEGGVGNVYLAEQLKPVRRQVALKIIKAGMDTKSVIARFEAERQALAMMDHPNIAHVLNAGETETGRPYFVMELVHGKRITIYCDEQQLGIRQRLGLFIQVCHAIQHAHQKGIIHRDIKPSNVLISLRDGIPSPIVIDFGIAKATSGELLTDKTVNTSMGPIIGTPAYMSPEQTNLTGSDIDTRSDIYSLGVLLYELLTGQTPFDQKELLKTSIDEMCRIVRTTEPPRPSVKFDERSSADKWKTAKNRHVDPKKLYALLSGDLDWIVMMALDKDRAKRYETAHALAVDIEHFIRNEPVLACPPSRLYRFRKLVRRNKRIFATATTICLALVFGFGMSSWFLVKEHRARQRAVIAEQQQSQLRMEAEDRERIAHAAFLISQDKLEEADQVVGEITSGLTPSLETETVLRKLGEWRTLQGRWDEAAARFNLLLQVDIRDDSWAITEDLLMAGPILIERGDLQGYRQFREAAMARYRGTTDPVFAERTLKISLLLPAEEQEMEQLQTLYDVAATATQGPVMRNDIMSAWRSISLALMAYRQGFYPTAVAWSQRSLTCNLDNPARIATAHIIKAMALQRLDEEESAKTELALGREMIDAGFAGGLKMGDGLYGFWYDWLFARILLREAETLMAPDGTGP